MWYIGQSELSGSNFLLSCNRVGAYCSKSCINILLLNYIQGMSMFENRWKYDLTSILFQDGEPCTTGALAFRRGSWKACKGKNIGTYVPKLPLLFPEGNNQWIDWTHSGQLHEAVQDLRKLPQNDPQKRQQHLWGDQFHAYSHQWCHEIPLYCVGVDYRGATLT